MTRGKDPSYMYHLYKPDISLCGVIFKFIIILHMSLTSVHTALVSNFILYTHFTLCIYLCTSI